MRTRRKIAALACSMLLIVGVAAASLAYLTSHDTATNTFTVGNVEITLDEKDVDNDANTSDNVTVNGATRDTANEYHLLPGGTYEKDPTVHVSVDSEDCWVFVIVDNQLEKIEAAVEYELDGVAFEGKTADQMTQRGWQIIAQSNGCNVWAYEQVVSKEAQERDIIVFSGFGVRGPDVENDGSVNEKTASGKHNIAYYQGKTIKVNAYAVQADGFDTAIGAWEATFAE